MPDPVQGSAASGRAPDVSKVTRQGDPVRQAAQRFRKRPVEIEAVRVSDAMIGAAHAMEWLPTWLAEAYENGDVHFQPDGMLITTLEGTMHADRSDWIIRGVEGELYPCKPLIFEATYEPC